VDASGERVLGPARQARLLWVQPASPELCTLWQTFSMVLRDAERVCSQCGNTRRCKRELDAGTAAAHGDAYCPNAATFDDLVECAEVPALP
jgi:hypothetical protein